MSTESRPLTRAVDNRQLNVAVNALQAKIPQQESNKIKQFVSFVCETTFPFSHVISLGDIIKKTEFVRDGLEYCFSHRSLQNVRAYR